MINVRDLYMLNTCMLHERILSAAEMARSQSHPK